MNGFIYTAPLRRFVKTVVSRFPLIPLNLKLRCPLRYMATLNALSLFFILHSLRNDIKRKVSRSPRPGIDIRKNTDNPILGIDTPQSSGKDTYNTYYPGGAKLLAKRSVRSAAYTNDNYVYFALSKLMEKNFGQYPIYPTAWDINKGWDQNMRRSQREPGYRIPRRNITDLIEEPTGQYEVISAGLYPESDYPSWYRSIMSGKRNIGEPNLLEAFNTPLNFSKPHIHDVICETSRHSGSIADCGNAFDKIYANPQAPAKKGRRGEWNWEGVNFQYFSSNHHAPACTTLYQK